MNKKIIFEAYTDAASFNNGLKDPSKPQISASVGLITYNDIVIESFHEVNDDTTISFGELNAIYNTLQMSCDIVKKIMNKVGAPPPYNINLYSDSGYCVNSLMKWMKGWKRNAVNGIWYSSTGKVAYQEIFKLIDKKFMQNDMYNINIYHIKGHINVNSRKQLMKALKTFKTMNGFSIDEEELIHHLHYNDACDKYAVKVLKKVKKKRGIESE